MKKDTTNPLVTVGISLYNYEKYIKECLESVINQTYNNIEIIVVDDGSKDDSYNVAKKTLENQDKKSFIVKTKKNAGVCEAFNDIAKMANGKYISFLDADDYWDLCKIELQVKVLEKDSSIGLVHSNSFGITDEGKIFKKTDFSSLINSGDVFESMVCSTGGINSASFLYKTEVYNHIGYYDSSFAFEDTDFWLRLSKQYKVGFINKELAYIRRHGENLSDNSARLKFYNNELIKIYDKNVTEPNLKRYIILKMLGKSWKRALRTFQLRYFIHYIVRYIKYKYFNIIDESI